MPLKILSLAEFAFGLAGFIASLLPSDTGLSSNGTEDTGKKPRTSRRRLIIVSVFLLAFIATGAVTLWEDQKRSLQLQEVSAALLEKLGNDAKSIDQLHEDLLFLSRSGRSRHDK